METKARTSENMPLMFRRRKKGKIKAVATGVFFMAAVFLFFAGQVLGDENGMVIQTTKGQDMVSPEVYATLEGVQQVKEKQQRYIENINKSQNGEDDNLIYRHNLDGSFSITDKKEGMFSLFDKTGKAISCVDVKTGEKIEFNTEGKIEAVEEADGSRTEYLYDKEGEVLDVLKYDKDGKTKDESEEITERIDVAKETKALLQKEEKKETLVIKGENAGIANLEAEENIIEKVLSVIEELSIFAKDAFIKVSSWLQTQIDNVINCAVKALENIIGFQSPHAYRQAGVTSHQSIEELAQETLLADILGGVIDENTRGKLETSMYAIKEAALQNGIELSGIKVDYNQLFDFYHSPFTIHYSPYIICHLSAGHYIVVTNVAENGVSYIDSEGNENTISKEVFIGAWSGNVLLPLSWLSGERGKELTDEELKSIKGSGTTYNCNFDDGTSPGENGFTVGATGEGSVIVEEDAEHGGYSAKLWGNESHDSVVSMEKIFILEEAGEVNFYWKVSSEEDYDYLKFYIDDVEQVKISGEVDWESRSYDLSAGEHILKWMYEKDGSDSEGSDAGWIDDINVTGNAAEEELVSDDVIVETGDYIGVKYTGYLEDGSVFDSNEDSEDFLYFTVGSGEMIEGFDESVIGLLLGEKITVTIPPEKAYGLEGEHELAGKTLIFDIQVMEINDQQTAETVEEFYFDDGVSPEGNGFTVEATGDGDVLLEEDGATGYSVKIWGNDSHDSVTSMEKVFILGQDGKVTFYWKVSSEADYDCFKFYIDDVEQDKISGEVDWEYKTYDLSAGEHTLRWAYEKDGSASESSDAGWVDDITITQNKEEVPSNDTVVETGDYIGVKYTGRLEDGSIFDSNEDSGELLYFTVGSGEMIEGFDEAVIGLLLGEKITVTIPPEKAYGLEGEHELAGKTLIFDIEIVEIGSQQSDTEEEVLYSYNFDGGSIFDSNEDSGELLYFTVGLGEMIEGFDEAVVGGVLGQKITVTIPPEKAYGLEGDHPLAGKTLIFDIQVMEINSRQSLIVGEIPYSCYFDDGISPAENDFTVGTTAEGNVLLEEDIKYGGYSVKIWGNDSHSGVTYMEKAFLLEQDSEVNFYWKVSSEEDYDYLKFYIDDVEQDKISGEAADWAYKTYYLSQGEHALKWTYEKDSNVSNGSDGGWVDDIKVSKYEAQDDIDWDEIFKNLENSSENGDTNDDSLFDLSELYDSLFSSSSSKTWVPSSFDEVVMAVPLQKRTRAFIPQELQLKSDDNLYAADTSTGSVEKTKTKQTAVSYKYAFDDGTSPGKNGFAAGGSGGGAVYVDSRTAYNDKGYSMKLDGKDTQKSVTYAEKVVSLKKAGEVSFLWKVSSEAGQDYLKFYVDGIKQDEISGEKDWHDKKYNLSEGEHTLKWEYSKNTDISNAEDAGWIDEIVIKTVKDSSAAVKKKGGGNVKNGGNAKK